jgi:hypothetical protein
VAQVEARIADLCASSEGQVVSASVITQGAGLNRVTAVLTATSSTVLHSDTIGRTPHAHVARVRSGTCLHLLIAGLLVQTQRRQQADEMISGLARRSSCTGDMMQSDSEVSGSRQPSWHKLGHRMPDRGNEVRALPRTRRLQYAIKQWSLAIISKRCQLTQTW